MLGVIYILASFLIGYVINSIAFPNLGKLTDNTFDGHNIKMSSFFVTLPACYFVGTLILTWVTYFVAYIARNFNKPLIIANLLSLFICFIVLVVYCYIKRNNMKNIWLKSSITHHMEKTTTGDFIFLGAIFTLAFLLMWTTFFIKGNHLYVGVSVFSDFSPHIGMIRSFSKGNNFPTWYSHFAGEDIRYHFMFQFMVGNLEFLGLPLDVAFNVPSILSLIGTFMLLFVLTVKITGSKMAGYLAALFFAFRSSSSLFLFLAEIPKGNSILKALIANKEFLGFTPNENWGLWNLNVYCNQRHLAFSFGIMLLILLLFLPSLYQMAEQLKIRKKGEAVRYFIMDKEGWAVSDIRLAIAAGIILGSIAFWNGAVLIAAISILFLVGIACNRRSELLITALIATILSVLQSRFFMEGSSIHPSWYFGFIAENKTFFGVAEYLLKLLGILPVVLIAAFLIMKGIKRYLFFAFSMPLILAFTVSLTVDVTVNHKYIMIAVMLLGILVADFLETMFRNHDLVKKIGCIFLCIILTATGVYDFITVMRKNVPENAIVLNLEDPLTKWVEENSDSKDIYLTSNYALNQLVLGGAMLYQGWQYYAWSAGYDTVFRDTQVKLMYEADTSLELKNLVKQNNIRFIVVDYDNRCSDAYLLNERNIRNTYECVFEEGTGEFKTSIYDTTLPIIGNK